VKKKLRISPFENYLFDLKDKNKLSFASVSTIYEDENKNIWIGGYGGLDKINTKTGKVSPAKFINKANGTKSSLPTLAVFDMVRAPQNKNVLWISNQSSGIIAYNIKNSTYRWIIGSDELNTNTFYGKLVYEMKYDRAGNLWLATNKGLNEYVMSTGKYKYYPYFDAAEGFPPCATTALYIDFPRGIWIGTSAEGLFLFHPVSGKITRYLFSPGNAHCISSNNIKCIAKDSKGNLWIGTNGGGLNKFDPKTHQFTWFTSQNGLPNDVVYGILEDHRGNLWMSTNKGLSKFNPVSGTFRNYDEDDGLQSNEFNTGAYFKAADGKMFFGGIKGVTSFFPEKIKTSKYNPPVVLTQFFLFNKPVALSKLQGPQGSIKLSYKDDIFAFQFASLDFTNPVKNKYAYRLKGFQNKWIYTDAGHRMATFTNISPGNYVFQARGTNADGIWSSKTLSIPVVIVPPFWGTLWFKVTFILILGLLVYGFFRRRIN
jgi:ligand-binding sensor domain-containing protein